MNDNIIEFKNVSKYYDYDGGVIKALDDVSFTIKRGDLTIILGDSGAGKSTALNILGGMGSATSGQVIVDGNEITKFNSDKLTSYRRNNIGFVFQFYNLIQNLTVTENVELASQLSNDHFNINEIIEKVGLKDRVNNFPSELSGGEQQRVAIARAIAKKPTILLCDEPTGALDYKTGKLILSLIQDINKKYNITVIIITHNSLIKGIANKVISFKSGKVISEVCNDVQENVEDLEW